MTRQDVQDVLAPEMWLHDVSDAAPPVAVQRRPARAARRHR